LDSLEKRIDRILATSEPEELLEWNEKFALHTHQFLPFIVKETEGIVITDTTGRKYLDFLAQATCVNVGYNNREVIEAVKEQAEKMSSLTATCLNPTTLKLQRLLAEIAPEGLVRSIMISGGSEANEVAIKIARRYTKRYKIVSRWAGYHGNTAVTLGASGVLLYKRDFDPVLPGFIHVSPPYCYRCDFGLEYPDCGVMCARMIEHAITYEDEKQVAAVIAEPIIGWGGAIVPPDEYFPMVREICDEHDVLLILDEVLTGFGRTGKMFACEHYGVSPDIMTLAKGISSIYVPCSAVIAREKVAEGLGVAPSVSDSYIERGITGITCMNHPLACAAALANIKFIVEKKLPENADKVGEYFLRALRDIAEEKRFFGEVRGKGLLIGLEVVKDKDGREPDIEKAEEICFKSIMNGLIIINSKWRARNSSIILFTPPLIVTKEDVDKALEIFQNVVTQSS